ncbi:MAG: hypothetical protein WC707_00005 [Candidatus Babeliaceae bacterium]|jgi:hypothetical protein
MHTHNKKILFLLSIAIILSTPTSIKTFDWSYVNPLTWNAKITCTILGCSFFVGGGIKLYKNYKKSSIIATPVAEEDKLPIVYSDKYNMSAYGLEKLHPFPANKYRVAARIITQALQRTTGHFHEPQEVSRPDLERVHPAHYLDSLKESTSVAKIVELPLGFLPNWFLQKASLFEIHD